MLKQRIIPRLLYSCSEHGGRTVSTVGVSSQFDSVKIIGSPISQCKILEAQKADEICIVDRTRNDVSWHLLLEAIKLCAKELATPLTVGGNICNTTNVEQLLRAGADKIVVNSRLYVDDHLSREIVRNFGSQVLVVSIDVMLVNGVYKCQSNCGKQSEPHMLEDWLRLCEERECGEILISSINRDGTGMGLDLALLDKALRIVSVPVLIAGGAGNASHFSEALKLGASGVVAGTYFAKRDQNPIQCRAQLINQGLAVRKP